MTRAARATTTTMARADGELLAMAPLPAEEVEFEEVELEEFAGAEALGRLALEFPADVGAAAAVAFEPEAAAEPAAEPEAAADAGADEPAGLETAEAPEGTVLGPIFGLATQMVLPSSRLSGGR